VAYGTRNYLKATFAPAVPASEARQMLAANAAGVFGFDLARLTGTLPGPARMRTTC